MNKAILINPFDVSIKEVTVDGFEDIQKHVCCDCFTVVRGEALKDNVIYCDDEGLINGTARAVEFVESVYPSPLAGNILIMGDDGHGGDKDVTLSRDEVKALVKGIRQVVLN
jgi:hypothetical protein